MERESKTLEYKASVSKSYLKTVSAYANFQTGRILFGVTDDKARIGIQNPEQVVLQIENQINDNIHPHPDFSFEIADDQVITLTVKKGKDTPYCYQGKAYKRNDFSTVEVTPMEFKNLTLKSLNLTFSEIPSANQSLTFNTFSKLFFDKFGIETHFPDTWITLGLYSKEGGYTNGAELLSDQNSFPGIDVVIYGESQAMIKKRVTLEKQSVFDCIEKCMTLFLEQYTYETVVRLFREVKEQIPASSFREAITNAVIHREWQIHSTIKVEFFPDRLIVTSPGDLPEGMDVDDYLSNSHLSILRNQSLALVFLRLGLIESLGSGIPKILESYSDSVTQPAFQITSNMISVTLPVLSSAPEMTMDQKEIYQLIQRNGPLAPAGIVRMSKLSRSTVQRNLNTLVQNNILSKTGNGRSVRYQIR